MMIVEQSVECELAEAEVLGGNLPQCHFAHHNHDLTRARTQAKAVGSRLRIIAYERVLP
jgi:hypothetical protein